jgi:hypothetical protein
MMCRDETSKHNVAGSARRSKDALQSAGGTDLASCEPNPALRGGDRGG